MEAIKFEKWNFISTKTKQLDKDCNEDWSTDCQTVFCFRIWKEEALIFAFVAHNYLIMSFCWRVLR